MYPLTLSYCPSVVPVTAIFMKQLVPAVSAPPVRAIVLVAVVVVKVPPHTDETESEMDRPEGRTSVKAMPVKFLFPGCVLLIVNESVEFVPFTIGSGEKDLAMVAGGVGIPQPVKVTLSIIPSEPGFVFPELKKYILTYVVAAGGVNVSVPPMFVSVVVSTFELL